MIQGISQEYRRTFLQINFLRLIHLEIFLKEFHYREAVLGDTNVKTSLTSENGQGDGVPKACLQQAAADS